MQHRILTKEYYLDKLQEHEEAIVALEKAIMLDPRKPNALFYKGIVLR